jgi:hypothetical protein
MVQPLFDVMNLRVGALYSWKISALMRPPAKGTIVMMDLMAIELPAINLLSQPIAQILPA